MPMCYVIGKPRPQQSIEFEMSSSNTMEVITRGSYEAQEQQQQQVASRSSTSHSMRTESQISLEYLPPEAPHYSCSSTLQSTTYSPPNYDSQRLDVSDQRSSDVESCNSKEELVTDLVDMPTSSEGMRTADQLYEQIQQLSNKIHSELGTMDDIESLESYRPTPSSELIDRELESIDSEAVATDCKISQNGRLDGRTSSGDQSVPDDQGKDVDDGVLNLSRGSTVVEEDLSLSENFTTSAESDCSNQTKSYSDNLRGSYTANGGSGLLESYMEGRNSSGEGMHASNVPAHLDFSSDGTSSETGGVQLQEGNIPDITTPSSSAMSGSRATSTSADGWQFSDAKTQKAYEKMKKLDEKLADLSKREREVKRQRKLLEQQVRHDDSTQPSDCTALVIYDEDNLTVDSTSPVFPTQVDDTSSTIGDNAGVDDPKVSAISGMKGKRKTSSSCEDCTTHDKESRNKHDGNITGVNFIKRNIELAGDVGAVMTEGEKQRLEQLLSEDPDIDSEDPNSEQLSLPATVIHKGEGFTYSGADLERMTDIDSRLQTILPASDWKAICSGSPINTPSLTSHDAATELHQSSSTSTRAILLHGEETDEEESPIDGEPGVATLNQDELCPHAAKSTVDSYSRDSIEKETGHVNRVKHIGTGELTVVNRFQMSHEERDRINEIEAELQAINEERKMVAQTVLPHLEAQQLEALLYECNTEQHPNRII